MKHPRYGHTPQAAISSEEVNSSQATCLTKAQPYQDAGVAASEPLDASGGP